jgi:glycosyltransferase involved in cell wall biosynthesis
VRTVSVIVPTYNCAARLVAAVQSICAQTYPEDHIEIIVVDDGSTDFTAECIGALQHRCAQELRYVRQENAGPAAARNHGIRLAHGDVVAFLDADDAWQPRKLEAQLPLLQADVGLVYCDASFVDAYGNPIDNYVRRISAHRGDILLPLFCEFFLLTSAVVVDRQAINHVDGFDERLAVGEDYEFFLRLATRFEADFVNERLLRRCVRPDSLSRRDYVLDARNDLATLTAFLEVNPQFARTCRRAVRRRIARCHYDLAWRFLSEDRRDEAIPELLRSLGASATFGATRTLVRALLPRSAGA